MDSIRLLIDRISTNLAITSEKLIIENSSNKLDLNIFLESVYLQLFNVIYGTSFENTNMSNTNYPAIDGIDVSRRIGVQITSTTTNKKIESTIRTLLDHGLDQEIDRLVFIFLKRKKRFSPSFKEKINKLVHERFDFDLDRDIYDHTDFYNRLLNEQDFEKVRKVNEILDKSVGVTPLDKEVGLNAVSISFHKEELENVYLLVNQILQKGLNVFTICPDLYKTFKQKQHKFIDYLILVKEGQKMPSVKNTIMVLSNKHIANLYGKNTAKVCPIYKEAIARDNTFQVVSFERFLNTIEVGDKFFRSYLSLEPSNVVSRTSEIVKNLLGQPNSAIYSIDHIKEELIRIFPNFELSAQFEETDFNLFQFVMTDQPTVSINYLVLTRDYNLSNLVQIFKKQYAQKFGENLNVLIPKKKNQKTRKRIENVQMHFSKDNVAFIDEYLFDRNFRRIEKSILLENENYISPVVLDEDGIARISDIVHWVIDDDSSAIAVIKAAGGVGKTTVCKKINDILVTDFDRFIVIFIDAVTYIKRFKDRNFIDDTEYDLYNIYKACTNHASHIDRNSFNLNYSMGNIIVIFDGVDEIISTIPLFDIDKFLTKLESIHNIIGKGKILINCRDTYVEDLKNFYKDEKKTPNYTVVFYELLSFNYALAQAYFEQFFEGEQLKVSLKLLKDFEIERKVHEDEFLFAPFVLEIIVGIVEGNFQYEELDASFNSRLLLPKIDLDFITYRVCSREILKKLEHGFPLVVDDQVRFMNHLAVQEKGVIANNAFVNVLAKIDVKDRPEEVSKGLYDHPFLMKSNGDFKFRYGFLTPHFKAIHIFNILNKDQVLKFNDNNLELFAEDLTYDSFIFKSVKERIYRSEHELKQYYTYGRNILEDFQKFDHPNDNIVRKAISNLALLFISFEKSSLKQTEVFSNLFKEEGYIIRNFCLVDVPDKMNLRLDFSGLWMTDTYISHFKDFFRCTFAEDTYFDENCEISNVFNPEIDFSTILVSSNNFSQSIKGDNSAYKLLQFLEQDGGYLSQFFKEVLGAFKSSNKMNLSVSKAKIFAIKGLQFDVIQAVIDSLVKNNILQWQSDFEIHLNPTYKTKVEKYLSQDLPFPPLNRAIKSFAKQIPSFIGRRK